MDVDTALNDLRERFREADRLGSNATRAQLRAALDETYEAFLALDQWLVAGGFLPSEWDRAIPALSPVFDATEEDEAVVRLAAQHAKRGGAASSVEDLLRTYFTYREAADHDADSLGVDSGKVMA